MRLTLRRLKIEATRESPEEAGADRAFSESGVRGLCTKEKPTANDLSTMQ